MRAPTAHGDARAHATRLESDLRASVDRLDRRARPLRATRPRFVDARTMLLAAATMENRKPPMVCQQSDERSSLVAPSRDARATPKRSNSLKYASLCTLALVGTCAAIAGPHRAARPLEAAGITNPSPEKTSHVERSSSRRALLAMHDGYGSPPPDTTTTYDETYYSYPDSSPDVYYASPPTTEPRRRSRDPDCPDETYDETYYSYPDHDDGDWDHDDHDDHDHDHDRSRDALSTKRATKYRDDDRRRPTTRARVSRLGPTPRRSTTDETELLSEAMGGLWRFLTQREAQRRTREREGKRSPARGRAGRDRASRTRAERGTSRA